MSKLPPYLDNIINIMARAEERSGGMKATQAAAVFREELINESLTAKANPGKVKKNAYPQDNRLTEDQIDSLSIEGWNFTLNQKPDVYKDDIPSPSNIGSPTRDYRVHHGILYVRAKYGTWYKLADVKHLLKSDPETAKYVFYRDPRITFRNFRAVVREIIEKGLAQEAKKNPRLSKGLKPSYFNKRELARGTAVELEHTNSRKVAERIAMDHLTEDENYYKKLEKMEANPHERRSSQRRKGDRRDYSEQEAILDKLWGGQRVSMNSEELERFKNFLSVKHRSMAGDVVVQQDDENKNKYRLHIKGLTLEDIDSRHSNNPTIKPFHEIYEVAGKQFADSPLGKSLGGFNGQVKTGGDRGMGRKFFEDLRNFCSNTSDSVIKGIFEKQLKRFNPGSKMPYDSFLENAGGEYPKGGLKNKDVKERVKIQREVESVRYYRLAVSTIIFGLIEPIFQMTKDDLELFLYAMLPQPRNFSDEEMRQGKHLPEIAKILEKIASPKQRKSFIEAILQIMKEREGIVSASIKASEYIGGQYWSGRKIEENVLMQVAELKKIKDDSGKVAVVPPEAMIPR